jgi:pyrimidine operon attenuation protein/uracil phosphoribosyltransferase
MTTPPTSQSKDFPARGAAQHTRARRRGAVPRTAARRAQHADPHHALAGIASGGAWLAERLQKDLGLEGPAGVLSSVMHRDDFAQRGLAGRGADLAAV